jgi:3-hydroxybutyryl-CoA dehydrogenase
MSNMKIAKVGIIGAGQMGCGIAQVCAAAGYHVGVFDAAADRIQAGIANIDAGLSRRVKSGKLTEDAKAATLARIVPVTGFEGFSDFDLVIESATENEAIKRQIFEAVTPHLKADCIIASNTSSISITRLAATTGRPEKFMGIHFMNPVPVMELVELIRGIATDETVFKTIQAFTLTLGKTTAISEDYPAFIVNRILLPMINEAIYTLYEGVGSVTAIDTAMKLGAHHPMGPLELADFIGLDTCLSVMQVLHDGLADSKYRPCPLLVKYVEAGWLGRKVKRGFYDYRGETPVPTR